MVNFDLTRLSHRHGDEWYEMKPTSSHSPDGRDPERKLLAGEQAFRCTACDEEVTIKAPDQTG